MWNNFRIIFDFPKNKFFILLRLRKQILPIDTGDTAWMLIASSLVLLMIPALGLFEAGLLRRKNTVSVFMQIFFGLAILSVMWFTFGFSLSFGPDTGTGLSGNTDWTFLNHVPYDSGLPYAPTIPGVLFAKFQMMFAVITPLLLTGAIAERMKFSAYVIFIVAWSALIYYPLVHWIWGGGWLGKIGVVDFAGGIVIHTSAGMGALAVCIGTWKATQLWTFNYDSTQYPDCSFRLIIAMARMVWI